METNKTKVIEQVSRQPSIEEVIGLTMRQQERKCHSENTRRGIQAAKRRREQEKNNK